MSYLFLDLAKLEASKLDNIPAEPIKEEITFDDFTKLDVRIGKIVEAEKVKKTKKLLHLKVDVGGEIRTIVSGIAESYTPEASDWKTSKCAGEFGS